MYKMKIIVKILMATLFCCGMAGVAQAEDESETGLALPRMVSLRSSLINARSGPGSRYPLRWKLLPSLNCGVKLRTGKVLKAGCIRQCFRDEDL